MTTDYMYVRNAPTRLKDPTGYDAQGCDPPMPDCLMTQRQRECCDQHDCCYAMFDCDATSWFRDIALFVSGNDYFPSLCMMCNAVAVAGIGVIPVFVPA